MKLIFCAKKYAQISGFGFVEKASKSFQLIGAVKILKTMCGIFLKIN